MSEWRRQLSEGYTEDEHLNRKGMGQELSRSFHFKDVQTLGLNFSLLFPHTTN